MILMNDIHNSFIYSRKACIYNDNIGDLMDFIPGKLYAIIGLNVCSLS
jgi:hypothetical protein